MMVAALTSTPWLAVLDRIVNYSDDETTATLARMLYEVISEANDTTVAQILDRHAYRLLGSLS
jgi:hypothetical protein